MKKTLSLILALLMSASCAATIFADEAVATSAIAEDAPAAEEEVVAEAETDYDLAIEFLVNKKIMRGMTDGLLHAERPVKRYEMAILAARIATGWTSDADWMNGPADDTKFTDLEGSGAKDALGALSYANQNGIVVGYGDGTFKPENTVTYRDALAIAVRTLGYSGSYPWGIIEKAVSLGLTKDITGVAYTDEIDRGVAAQIIYNALFATAASGKKLAMESFGCEYGWETIVVVADDKVHYEATGADSYKAGVVSFKLVNKDGTFASDVYNVAAELEFGAFYNALFEKKGDLVDLIKAIEIEPTVISNRGNDLETADAIGAYLKDLTVVDKYNVKTLAATTLYNNEIILKGVDKVSVLTGYNTTAQEYAIDWATGDILVKSYDKDGKFVEYVVDWYYSELLDTYYRHVDADTVAGVEDTVIGWDIMDEKDLADLKAAIKASYEVYTQKTGYTVIAKPAFNAYADLTVYDVNGGAYATYEGYSFGYYSGIAAADKCGDCSTEKVIKIGNYEKILEGTCTHKYQETWTIDELTEGYTGYVIFGVNEATQEFKIVKEIPAYSADLTEDSYVTVGIVRGFNASKNEVTIGNTVYSYEYKGLNGAESFIARTNENDFFNTLFNQFVEFVVVDGKIVKIDCKNTGGNNYLVVEKYLGIDNDGYIVVQAYNTADCKIDNYRIGAFDGWKQGSAFFYEDVIGGEFTKGNVYTITSTDTTETNGKVYYVTGNTTATTDVVITIEDNYRTVNGSTKKMSPNDKYVIIGEYNAELNFKPVYLYQGIAADGWTVTGKLLATADNLWIITEASEVEGFNADSYKIGFVSFANGITYDKVGFDGYMSDYYYYGATEYKVIGWNLLTGAKDASYTGYNLKLAEDKIYTTIDDEIIYSAGMGWEEFWTAFSKAYADQAEDTADYFVFDIDVTKDTTYKTVSLELSDKDGNADFFLNFKNAHDDLVNDSMNVYAITVADNGDLTKIEAKDIAKFDWEGVDKIPAKAFLRTSDMEVFIFINAADAVETVVFVPETEAKSDVVLGREDVEENVYIDATATLGTTADGKYTIDGVTFELVGADLDNMGHATIDEKFYFFGETGACTTESWNLVVEGDKFFDANIVAGVYDDEHEAGVDCDLVKKVAVSFAPVTLTEEWQVITISFDTHWIFEGVKTDFCTFEFHVSAKYNAETEKVEFGFAETYEQVAGFFTTFVKSTDAKIN